MAEHEVDRNNAAVDPKDLHKRNPELFRVQPTVGDVTNSQRSKRLKMSSPEAYASHEAEPCVLKKLWLHVSSRRTIGASSIKLSIPVQKVHPTVV